MNPPGKDDVIDLLESIAQLLDLQGGNPFKIRAYTNAARAIETFAGDLNGMAVAGTLKEIEGIGEAIAAKLEEFLTTGKLEYFEKLRITFPPTIFDLFEVQGLGAKKIKAMYDQLQVASLRDLEAACKDGRVEALAGFGEKTAAKLIQAMEDQKKHAGSFRIGSIAAEARAMLEDLQNLPQVHQAAIAGSFRRRKEVVRDLDFITATNDAASVAEFFVKHPSVESVMAHGTTKCSVRLKSGIQADLRTVANEHFPFALAYFTGSKEHNIVLRQRALDRGWTLNEYRLGVDEKSANRKTDPIPAVFSEADLHLALGIDYVEPELRENLGEIQAAERHELPDLVELENLRGTFHNHTTASDGRSTLDEMAAAAQELGLDYLGIADHSKSSFQAHGLDAERLLVQVNEIQALNKTYEGFRIFTGTECDLLKDGSLDFPDEILAQLDYVVASVHGAFTLDEATMTRRIIKAIENPYVTMLGHLTGRLLLSREPYAVNIPAIIDACAETGTIIELNANPRRLDMDWRWWPLAKSKGVECSINPDAHHISGFQDLWHGSGTARKGWLERRNVINCLSLEKVEQRLRKKRG